MKLRPWYLTVAAVCAAAVVSVMPALAGFYEASPSEIPGKPGTIIRTEPMSGAPLGAKAYRVLYRSTSFRGEPIAVSGVVIVPLALAPPGGRKIVAWGHPTSGVVPKCAPSIAILFYDQVMGLSDFLADGYIVAATDYPGLGTPGPHPYLIGNSEGYSVLDSVRAAREVPEAEASDHFALWGHSQGGQAVLYAAKLAGSYAPELKLAGVAAAAPATELGKLMEDDINTTGGKNLMAMTIWSWNKVFNAPMNEVVEPNAIKNVDDVSGVCVESLIDFWEHDEIGKRLDKSFLKVKDILDYEPWKAITAENTIGTLPPEIPVFLAQGTKDTTVDPPVTANYIRALCAAGSKVDTYLMPGVGHGFAAYHSASEAATWIKGRFDGERSPGHCPK
jgi:acetyl esterase/lipase